MPNRPTELPRWASAAGADVSTPTISKRAQGWFADESPAAGFLNFMQRMYGRWLEHYGASASVFDSLQAACSVEGEVPLGIGQTCLIDETEYPDISIGAFSGFSRATPAAFALDSFDPGGYAAAFSSDTASNLPRWIATDGEWLYLLIGRRFVGAGYLIRRCSRGGVIDATWSCTTAATVANVSEDMELWTDGWQIFLASATRLECFAMTGGAATWTVSGLTARAYRRVAANNTWVYIADGNDARAYRRNNGNFVHSVAHGGPVIGVAADNAALYVAGAGAVSIRRVAAGTGSAAASDAWTAVLGTVPDGERGRLLLGAQGEPVLLYTYDGDCYLACVEPRTGSPRWSLAGLSPGSLLLNGTVAHLAVDQRWAWTYSLSPFGVVGVEVATGRQSAFQVSGINEAPERAIAANQSMVSDGSFLWCIGQVVELTAPSTIAQTLVKFSRGTSLGLWRRVDPAQGLTLPLQQKIVPEGEF